MTERFRLTVNSSCSYPGAVSRKKHKEKDSLVRKSSRKFRKKKEKYQKKEKEEEGTQ
jgi:hypothetical protein